MLLLTLQGLFSSRLVCAILYTLHKDEAVVVSRYCCVIYPPRLYDEALFSRKSEEETLVVSVGLCIHVCMCVYVQMCSFILFCVFYVCEYAGVCVCVSLRAV
eukprot:GHVQ01006459.1.p2 GENE.GHVQ01006459.1~~GHVQ01006459.1.p2  ORF type:complete len:102 (+),score=13.75 GHVQ01006459.1:754-1059(+)